MALYVRGAVLDGIEIQESTLAYTPPFICASMFTRKQVYIPASIYIRQRVYTTACNTYQDASMNKCQNKRVFVEILIHASTSMYTGWNAFAPAYLYASTSKCIGKQIYCQH